MKLPTLTIDLGSSETKIHQIGAGVVLSEPSVIAISETGRRRIKATGIDAKNLIGKTVDGTVVCSPVFEGSIQDEQAAGLMIEHFLNKVTLKRLGRRPSVLFAVPCGADNATIKRFEKVLNDCDVYSIHFVESPVLAAIGAGVGVGALRTSQIGIAGAAVAGLLALKKCPVMLCVLAAIAADFCLYLVI